MAWDLEGLIGDLLVAISCGGEKGCTVNDLIDDIRQRIKVKPISDAVEGERLVEPAPKESQSDSKAIAAIWQWLFSRQDVSLGPERKYNNLTLDEVLAQSTIQHDTAETDGQDDSIGDATEAPGSTPMERERKTLFPGDMRAVLVEDTMWECLTGHGVDYARVPRSEWELLQGIASAKHKGILQGDLCRLTGQDKRSVPKRTDSLVRKGYITKRTILVRGTKTSNIWLNRYVPPFLEQNEKKQQRSTAGMNFDGDFLRANSDIVPWHHRWTGDIIDYVSLAATIMGIVKSWGVIRVQDLKLKLGVSELAWQRRVVSKTFRFLHTRGVAQYVGASLDGKLFKDCLKYVREMDHADWEAYLAVGKRGPADEPIDTVDADINANPVLLEAQPPWSLDEPLHTYLARTARSMDGSLLSNSDFFSLTIGNSFTRFLTTVVSTMVESTIQPPHLKHYQMRSEHLRTGKVASYKYWVSPAATDPNTLDVAGQVYGFPDLPAKTGMQTDTADFSVICKPKRHLSQATRGINKLSLLLDRDRAKAYEASENDPQENQDPYQFIVTLKVGSEALQNLISKPDESEQGNDLLSPIVREIAPEQSEVLRETIASEELVQFKENDPVRSPEDQERGSRHASAEAVAFVSGDVEMIEARPEAEDITAMESPDLVSTDIPEPEETQAPSSRGRGGRGRRGVRARGTSGRGRGKGRGGTSSSEGKPWKCEKCGGAWKNDIGLKYHLEKARVPCNPSFDPNAIIPKPGLTSKLKSALGSKTKSTKVSPQQEKGDNGPGHEHGPGNEREGDASLGEDDDLATLRSRREKQKKRASCSQKVLGARRLKPLQKPQFHPELVFAAGKSALLPFVAMQTIRAIDILDTTTRSNALSSTTHPTDRDGVPELSSASKHTDAHIRGNDESVDVMKRETDMLGGSLEANLSQETPVAAPTARILSQTALQNQTRKRVESLLQSILAENEGCFPGGEALWRALRVAWLREFSNENCPTNRAFKGVMGGLIRNKFVAEHVHAFRAHNGSFANVKIISLLDEDPFSPKARELLIKIKEVYPDPWLPEHTKDAETTSLRVNGELIKSKRVLPNELVELDAPVYAEQVAIKRRLQEDQPKRGGSKKRRLLKNVASGSRGKRGGIAGMYRFRTSSARHTPADVQRMANFSQNTKLEFLDPNTALEDDELYDPSPEAEYRPRMSREEKKASAKLRLFDKYGLQQQSHITVQKDSSDTAKVIPPYTVSSSNLGSWPGLDLQFFEDCDGSFTLDSRDWFPNLDWFSWCAINHAIDKTASAQASRGWFRISETDSRSRRFKDRLVATARVEMAWGDVFLTAQPGAAGPHNIYIHHWGAPVPITGQIEVYSWPEDGQYTQGHLGAIQEGLRSEGSTDNDSEFEEAVSVRLRKRKAYARGNRSTRMYQRSQPRDPLLKSVELKRRQMTAIPEHVAKQAKDSRITWDIPAPSNPEEVLAAIIAVRSLMGGIDRHIDWGFLIYLFPDLRLEVIRKHWLQTRKAQKPYIMELTRSFQEGYLTACETGELPLLDFENPKAYDWDRLIKWTMHVPSRPDTQIPNTVDELDDRFTLHDVATSNDNWRERFFHFQTSAYTRLELVTADPGAVTIDQPRKQARIDIDEVSRSWIRSLCCTGESDYAPEAIKKKLLTLAHGDATEVHALLQKAIARLTTDKVIHSKRGSGVFDSKPYRLMEPYLANLGRLAHWDNYKQAVGLKAQLDGAFRTGQTFMVPYALSDGAMMALLNLNAHNRVTLKGVDIPHIPFGFHPGTYESRKYAKSLYHFGIEALPTGIYQYNEEIPVLAEVKSNEPPNEGPGGSLPQWVDFFGRYDMNRWLEILAAVCFAYSTRGHMPIPSLRQHLRPILEEFEAKLLIDWGKKTGVLEDGLHGSVTVGEWWWLAVPVMKQQS